jgi:hypothetical protein
VIDVSAIAEGLGRFEARGPCTDAERRAAGWLHDELRDAGHEAWVETHWMRPQWALSVALHATIGVVASVAAITAPLVGLVAALVAAVSMGLEAAGLPGLLRLAFPRRATQNVLTVPDDGGHPAPTGAPAGGIMLLISARYDAPKGGIGRRFIAGRQGWVALALAGVAGCAGLRQLDLDGLWLGLLQFVPTIGLLLALAAAADVAVASSVAGGEAPPAVAVALLDELSRNPPDRLSPALLLHGALRSHLRRDKPDRRRTIVLELGPSGTPAFTASHPQLRAAAEKVGGVPRVRSLRPRRYPTLWIGVPTADERALDFALGCVDALDAALTA